MKTITVCSTKEGVGKTTLVYLVMIVGGGWNDMENRRLGGCKNYIAVMRVQQAPKLRWRTWEATGLPALWSIKSMGIYLFI